MDLNVLTSFPCKPTYYLTYPWKWFKDLRINLRNAYRRATKGWAPIDAWEMHEWFLTTIPALLRHIAFHGDGYPGIEPFTEPEDWKNWLCSMADELESLQEDKWFAQNEYEEEFHEAAFAQRHVEVNKPYDKFITTTYITDAQFEQIKEKYFNRAKELNDLRQQKLNQLFTELSKHFFKLYD